MSVNFVDETINTFKTTNDLNNEDVLETLANVATTNEANNKNSTPRGVKRALNNLDYAYDWSKRRSLRVSAFKKRTSLSRFIGKHIIKLFYKGQDKTEQSELTIKDIFKKFVDEKYLK